MRPPRPLIRRLVIALGALLCIGAAASDPAERLRNPAQEAHARLLFRQFRCLVCQNQSIDESDAPLAQDLRVIVREQIAGGRSDRQITDFLVRRYGEFVLLRPRFSPGNGALWLAPFAIVGAGGLVIALRRRRETPLEPGLTPAEQARLDVLTAAAPLAPATVPPQRGLEKGAETCT